MDDAPVTYQVFIPDICKDQMRAIAQAANRLGIQREVRDALQEAEFRLQTGADNWGESRDYFPVMKL